MKQPLCILCHLLALSLLLTAAAVAAAAEPAAAGAPAAETLPEGLQIVAIEAQPEKIQLESRFDYRQLLLIGHMESGEIVDLTRMAQLAQASTVADVSPRGLITSKQNGSEQLVFTFGDQSVTVQVDVQGTDQSRDVSFVRDVQPALSKMSCNAGTCHGSKDGKNGFKLSLRGYDPLFDHRALTDDIAARRFNRAAPDQSLMLLKATGSIPHVGGVRTDVGHPYYELIRSWIADGAKLDLNSPRVTGIEVFPKDPVVPRAGMRQQMRVLATYSDGAVRDVTREAFIESGNIEVVEADSNGILTLLRRGEAPVLVRFEGAYAATTLTVMGDRSGFVWQETPTYNYIDELVYEKLQRVKILPSGLCTDEDFVRRVYLDLTGLPPTAAQALDFLEDGRDSRTKREALVDRLVGGPEFVEHWTNKWADLLQVNRKFLGEEGSVALRNWIKQSIASNKPYDQFAYEVLTGSGSTLENPPAAYYKVLREPTDVMENTTHLFLAIRFNCNKCHDHPFERWTQDQYYNLSAYFTQIGRKEDPRFDGQKIGGSAVEGATPLVEVIYDSGSGEQKHDRTGQVVAPAFPYTHGDLPQDEQLSRREQLAHWIVSPENQYFASSYANRLWGYLFGPGIIEPIDDIRAGNPPTNPRLLKALTEDFVNSGFDVQHMFRTICKSRVYQHSVETNRWNEDDTINYSHALPRRLPAEVLYDAIHVATGSRPDLPGVPVGFRAAELPDAGVKVPFLDDFGRPVRESACECERSDGMVLGPIMKLVNGPTVAEAVGDPNSELAQLVTSEPDDEQLVRQVFLRFLSRYPTEDEVQIGIQALAQAGSEHEQLASQLEQYRRQLPARQKAWEEQFRPASWTVVELGEMKSQVGASFARQEDGSVLASGTNGKDVYTIQAKTGLSGITGIRLEALPDASLPAGGPGRAQNGNFVLSELTLTAAPQSDPAAAKSVALENASATFSQQSWAVAGAVDGKEDTGWAVSPEFNKPHTAVFETVDDIQHEGGSLLTFTLSQQFGDSTHTLGRFRLSVTSSPRPLNMTSLPEDIAAIVALPANKRSDEQQAKLTAHFRSLDSTLQELEERVKLSEQQAANRRLSGVQDLAWALINNPAFLFNR